MVDEVLIIRLAPVIIGLTIAFLITISVSIFLRGHVIEDRVNRALKGNQVDVKELEKARRRARVFNLINALVVLMSVLAAALTAYLYFSDRNRPARLGNWHDIFDPTPFAYAQTLSSPAAGQAAVTTPVQPFLGYMLSAILIVMLAVFVFAVIAVLVFRDVPENASRRTAANDIVKTFGGFFIGVLTSFLKQAIGG